MSIEPFSTTEISSLSGSWKAVAGAYLAEVHRRTGSTRTPQEYARYIERFLAGIDDPADATPAHLHALAVDGQRATRCDPGILRLREKNGIRRP